ncbi:MAG: O-antigen ligase family protein, partial [Desulfobacterales bacterium]
RYSLYLLLIFTPLALASVQGWAVSVIHFVTLIALTAFLIEKSLTWDWKRIRTSLDKPILCLLVLCFLSSVFSVHTYTSIWSSVLLLNYCVIFYLTIHVVRTRSQFRQIVYVIVFMAALVSIIGLLKKFCGNPFPWWDYTDFQNEPDRLSSTFGNADHLAGYMEMAIPLVLGLLLTGLRGIKLYLTIVLAVLLCMALIFSLSRGGWISAFAGIFFMSAALLFNRHFQSKRLALALVCGFFVVAFIILSSTPVVKRIRTLEEKGNIPTLKSRITVWGGIAEMIKDHPLLGTGPGTFATVFTQYQPPGFSSRYFMGHNDYLHLTAETGLPLIAVMAWMMVALFVRGFKKLNNPSRLVRGITLGAMSGITAILVHSIFDFNLHIPANAILFTVLAALVVSPIPDYGPQDKEVRGQRAGN